MTKMRLSDARIISARTMVTRNQKQKRFTAAFIEELASHTLSIESSPGVLRQEAQETSQPPLETPVVHSERVTEVQGSDTTPQALSRLERLQQKLLARLRGEEV